MAHTFRRYATAALTVGAFALGVGVKVLRNTPSAAPAPAARTIVHVDPVYECTGKLHDPNTYQLLGREDLSRGRWDVQYSGSNSEETLANCERFLERSREMDREYATLGDERY
jgi:hypothetical protein